MTTSWAHFTRGQFRAQCSSQQRRFFAGDLQHSGRLSLAADVLVCPTPVAENAAVCHGDAGGDRDGHLDGLGDAANWVIG